MQQLTFVGVHDDGEHLVLESTGSGQRFQVLIDSSLRNAVVKARRAHPARGLSGNGVFGPRDIQTRFRQGATVDEIVAESGWKPERVRRYEWPILAERSHIVAAAQHTRIDSLEQDGSRRRTLHHQIVAVREDWNFAEGDAQWNSWQREDGLWNVSVSVDYSKAALAQIPAGSDFPARFVYNPANQTVTAGNAVGEFLLGKTLEPAVSEAGAEGGEDFLYEMTPAQASPTDSSSIDSSLAEAEEPVESERTAPVKTSQSSLPRSAQTESVSPVDNIQPSAPAAADAPAAQLSAAEASAETKEQSAPTPRAGHLRAVPSDKPNSTEELLDELEDRRGQRAGTDQSSDRRVTQLADTIAEESAPAAAESGGAAEGSKDSGAEGSDESSAANAQEQDHTRKPLSGTGSKGKTRRPSVPSWDDIVFGNKH